MTMVPCLPRIHPYPKKMFPAETSISAGEVTAPPAVIAEIESPTVCAHLGATPSVEIGLPPNQVVAAAMCMAAIVSPSARANSPVTAPTGMVGTGFLTAHSDPKATPFLEGGL